MHSLPTIIGVRDESIRRALKAEAQASLAEERAEQSSGGYVTAGGGGLGNSFSGFAGSGGSAEGGGDQGGGGVHRVVARLMTESDTTDNTPGVLECALAADEVRPLSESFSRQ